MRYHERSFLLYRHSRPLRESLFSLRGTSTRMNAQNMLISKLIELQTIVTVWVLLRKLYQDPRQSVDW